LASFEQYQNGPARVTENPAHWLFKGNHAFGSPDLDQCRLRGLLPALRHDHWRLSRGVRDMPVRHFGADGGRAIARSVL
jgi:hypothetical protein